MTCFVEIRLRILNRFSANYRYWQNSNTIGSEDPANFFEGFLVFADMLQNVGGKDKVISRILKRQISNIYVMIHPFHKQIGRLVTGKPPSKHVVEKLLGCEVKHFRFWTC